jgi:hypothetical protein
MRTSILNAVRGYFRFSNRWLFRTPERALEEAYEAALTIRSIEEQHFGGNKITAASVYGDSVQTYFQEELRRCLNVIKIRLAEFRISRSILQFSTTRPITEIELNNPQEGGDVGRIEVIDRPAIILRKLRFIDEVFSRYTAQSSPQSAVIPVVDANQLANPSQNGGIDRLQSDPFQSNLSTAEAKIASEDIESIVDKTGVLPRSILKTVDRIKRELDPNAEREVVENFRSSKARTIVSLRLVLLFIVVPLLTQQVSKIVLVGPIVDHFRNNETVEVFLNEEMEEEAFTALNRYEEQLKFQMLIGKIEPMTEEELEENLRERAQELAEEYQGEGNDAVKNVFADIMAVAAFILLALSSRREIAVLKSFLDELVYGLSDSAKAFIIILLTDTFVGFHSPHGWEVLLEGASRHLGLPANRDFIFLFIATFPVILDTIFKYWIFRYLNRISPSAVATYRNMNE